MTEKTFHVAGIGNAIVDVMAYVDDAFIEKHDLLKGAMTLINDAEAELLYNAMGACAECSGGSVANTMAALASFGANGAFIGKVANDAMGNIFRHDLKSIHVDFQSSTAPLKSGSTARCLIAVTPDAERTMSTYLGVAGMVREDDIDEHVIASSQVLYIEGYLWDAPDTIMALRKAISIAKANKTKVAFSLSDLFCVDRHRASFTILVESDIDILFANEAEIRALYEVDSLDEAAAAIQGKCAIACLTQGSKGALIVTPTEKIKVVAEPTKQVVDTTGAGDLFAAGFLYGYTHDHPLHESGKLGAKAASHIISHLGARPMKPLKELVIG